MKTLLGFLLVLLAACGPVRHIRRAIDKPSRDVFAQERVDRAVAERRVVLGMTYSEVRRSRGDPVRRDWVKRFGGKRVRRWSYSFEDIFFDADGLVIGTSTAY